MGECFPDLHRLVLVGMCNGLILLVFRCLSKASDSNSLIFKEGGVRRHWLFLRIRKKHLFPLISVELNGLLSALLSSSEFLGVPESPSPEYLGDIRTRVTRVLFNIG